MFGIVVAKGLPAIIPRYVACYSRDIAPVKASNERAEAQVPAGRVVGCLFALIEGVDKDEVHLTRGGRRQFIAHDLPAPQQNKQSRSVGFEDLPRLRRALGGLSALSLGKQHVTYNIQVASRSVRGPLAYLVGLGQRGPYLFG